MWAVGLAASWLVCRRRWRAARPSARPSVRAAVPMLVHSPVTHARSLSLSLAQSVRAGEEPTNERRRASVFFGTSCCSGLLLPLFLPPSVAPSGLLCVPLTELTLPLVVHSLSLSLSLSTQNRKPSRWSSSNRCLRRRRNRNCVLSHVRCNRRRRRLVFGRWPRSRSFVRSLGFGQTKSASWRGAAAVSQSFALSLSFVPPEEKQFNKQRNCENEGRETEAERRLSVCVKL